MNIYRIKFTKKTSRPSEIVEADNVNGFDSSSDTYSFKIDGKIVKIVPKENVLSITKTSSGKSS